MKNKSVEKCIKIHYSKPKDRTIARIELRVIYYIDKMRKQHIFKPGKDNDSILLMAALDKVGYDNVKKYGIK
jgi:hypothetical protein